MARTEGGDESLAGDVVSPIAGAVGTEDTFGAWQAEYAKRGVPTFPVEITDDGDKKPMIKGYQRVGLRGSSELAAKFSAAHALGFLLGQRNDLMLADVDTRDERALADVLSAHGNSPIISRTASKGGFHVWYRYSDAAWEHYNAAERSHKPRRAIRPELDRPVDYLGGGFCVAPPSIGPKGRYEFIQGSLDDLDRLRPFAGIVPPLQRRLVEGSAIPMAYGDMVEGDGRDNALFNSALRSAKSVHRVGGTLQHLRDIAHQYNSGFAQPMEARQVEKITASAWQITVEGRNRTGQHGAYLSGDDVARLVGSDNDALVLLNWLRANEGPDALFWIANALHERLGMPRKTLSAARERLVDMGYIRRVRASWPGHPAIYQWARNGLCPNGGQN